jgi:hypothetical protein
MNDCLALRPLLTCDIKNYRRIFIAGFPSAQKPTAFVWFFAHVQGNREGKKSLTDFPYASITWIRFLGLRRSMPNSQPSSSLRTAGWLPITSRMSLGRTGDSVKAASRQRADLGRPSAQNRATA